MPTRKTSEVIQRLRRAALLRDGAGMTDGQLLDCFLTQRDDAAFAALVRRHGPMVWGVCRRALPNYHDAEDAFQATFLVLVRKAVTVEPKEMVANWLYGVAHQTALKARSVAARRKGRERQVLEMPEPAVEERRVWQDLQPLLDQELSRLPDKYRAPIVLCDLEGKTRKEAARQLGWPEGTVAGRLATARKMLARRLARRGVALSGGALAAVLSQKAASAGVPSSVVSSTIQAAALVAAGPAAAAGAISLKVAALTEGVMRAMLMSKLKAVMVVVLMAGFLATGATVFTPCKAAGQNGKAPDNEKQLAVADQPLPPGDAPALWSLQNIGYGNLRVSEDDKKNVDREQPDLGFYPPDKRLLGAQQTDALRKELDAARKARAKSFAKLQAIAAIEANLKKLRESTEEKLEREALDKIERAVLWYKDAKWLTEELWSVEKEAVPFPTDKNQSEKKK
jgi:RNA polymerase sigma factor (sigma-70 family)